MKWTQKNGSQASIFSWKVFYFDKHSIDIIPAGTEQEQTRYCFNIYDLNDDGFITKEEMMTMMKNCMVKSGSQEEESEEGVKVNILDMWLIFSLIW